MSQKGFSTGFTPSGCTAKLPPFGQALRPGAQLIDFIHFLIRCLRYRFRTERLQLKTLMRLDLRGATVLDIGANKGIYCFWLARSVGGRGRVIAFEPQPEMRGAIEHKARCLRLNNLSIISAALSEIPGKLILSRRMTGDGSASVESQRHVEGHERINVASVCLDDLPEAMLRGLKFIKCDVEGHELRVFHGGVKTLRRYRPVVQFESMSSGADTAMLFRFFDEIGYRGVVFLNGHYRHPSDLDKIPHTKFGFGGHRDFLFFPPECVGSTIPADLAKLFPIEGVDCQSVPAAVTAPAN